MGSPGGGEACEQDEETRVLIRLRGCLKRPKAFFSVSLARPDGREVPGRFWRPEQKWQRVCVCACVCVCVCRWRTQSRPFCPKASGEPSQGGSPESRLLVAAEPPPGRSSGSAVTAFADTLCSSSNCFSGLSPAPTLSSDVFIHSSPAQQWRWRGSFPANHQSLGLPQTLSLAPTSDHGAPAGAGAYRS